MYCFPEINHPDDVLPTLEGYPEFIVVERSGCIVVDYRFIDNASFGCRIANPETFDAARRRRECRGLKFDATSRRLIARPYHKFFNLGERREMLPDAIDWTRHHVVLEKLDGSMVHAALLDNALLFMTRMGATDTAVRALAYARAHPTLDYPGFCATEIAAGRTPIFEWCAPADRIVIAHDTESLILTASRTRHDGRYLGWDALRALAAPWGIPVVQAHNEDTGDLDGFVTAVRRLDDSEGRIVRFDDGHMVKLKADQYVACHKLLSNIQLEHVVVGMILAGREDDALPLLSPSNAAALRAYAVTVRAGIAAAATRLSALVAEQQAAGVDRKAFAAAVNTGLPAVLHSAAFQMWQGMDPIEAVRVVVARNLTAASRVDRVRSLWDDVRWETCLDDSIATALASG